MSHTGTEKAGGICYFWNDEHFRCTNGGRRTRWSCTMKANQFKQAGAGVRVAAVLVSGAVAACSGSLVSGPVGDASAPFANTDPGTPARDAKAAAASAPVFVPPPQSLAELSRAHAADPRNPSLSMAYVRGLKKAGKPMEALAVLDAVTEAVPGHNGLKVEHGLLALEMGQTEKAASVLEAAAGASSKDWRVLSGLGVATSSLGRQKEAQRHFAKALELSPNNPAILNNMAMSLILERKVDQAEAMLRRASKNGPPRQQVAQNLALTQALRSEGTDEGVQ